MGRTSNTDHWDAANEQPMHVFDEPKVVEHLLKLRDVLNEWHSFLINDWQPDNERMMIGRDVCEAVPETVIAFQDCFQRRAKEIAKESRELSRPFKQKGKRKSAEG